MELQKLLLLLYFVLFTDAHKVRPFLGESSAFSENTSSYGVPIWYSTKNTAKRQQSTIVAAPDEINSNGTDVVVSWNNIDYDYGDYVAVWCPPQEIPNGEASLGTALDIQVFSFRNSIMDSSLFLKRLI